ncbi:MAG: hypothetical protein QM731_26075 [Chitinophagaceae bacterium]
MNEYLNDLLKRMSDDSYRPDQEYVEGVYESSKTVSWEAHEEAKNLDDELLLPELYKLIDSSISEKQKRDVYFIIGFIGKNTNNTSSAAFLLDRVARERKAQIITLILDRLAEIYKPAYLDQSILYRLIDKKGARIRNAAYLALTNTENKIEEYLLSQLVTSEKADDTVAIIQALGYIGTEKSVMAIIPLVKSRKLDIKYAAQNTLPTIMIRANYKITEICRATKVSTSYVNHRSSVLARLTRPG